MTLVKYLVFEWIVNDSQDAIRARAELSGGTLVEMVKAAEVEAVLKDVKDTMLNLIEYWNGNHNEREMSDALEHVDREAQRLLAHLKGRL